MSDEYLSRALDADLPTEEKFVLLVLGDSAEPERGVVYPNYPSVARITGIPLDRVTDIVRGFIGRGILATVADPDALRIVKSNLPILGG